MNPDNYGSLEACQRLLNAGIGIETDCYWRPVYERAGMTEIRISGYTLAAYRRNRNIAFTIPAPSMAEVWRELPEFGKYHRYLDVSKSGSETSCGYVGCPQFYNTNPTDALIELWIWVLQEGGKG